MQRAIAIRAMILGATSAASLVAGCASTEPQTAERRDEKTYVTRSRIPMREGNTSNAVRSVDNRGAAESIEERSRIYIPPKGGPQ